MAQGYLLHDHVAHAFSNQSTTGLFPGLLTDLGLDVPPGSLVLVHSADATQNGGPTFDGAFKRLDPDANIHDNLVLGMIAKGDGTDKAPNVKWPAAGSAQRGAAISVWTGDVWPDITTIVMPNGTSERASSNVASVPYSTCSVGEDNGLLIAAGFRIKTPTTNGATFGDILAPSSVWAQIPATGNVPNGNSLAMVWNYWQQSARTPGVLTVQNLSINDSSLLSQGTVLALRSQIAAGGISLLDDRSMRGEL